MEQKYVMAAIDAALKAGEKILSIYNDPASDFEIERKADNSPLTIADRKAHEAIVAILNETPFPVLSEEGKHLGYETRREWDTAAGHAIARAAGMEVYQAGKEEPLRYNKEDLLNPWFIVEPKREH